MEKVWVATDLISNRDLILGFAKQNYLKEKFSSLL